MGRENGLALAVYGDRGSVSWRQREANSLTVRRVDGAEEVRRTGGAGLSEAAAAGARLPAGHPAGYLEALANVYRNFCLCLGGAAAAEHGYPGVTDGLRGMQFIEAVVRSRGAWGTPGADTDA